MKNRDLLFIGLIYYVGWFGCIFTARADYSFLSLLFPAFLIGYLRWSKKLEFIEIAWAAGITGIGILFDFILLQFGSISMVGEPVFLIPTWLLSIWLLFSFSIVKMAPRMQFPLWTAAILGLILGPLSYKSGEYFQVLTLTTSSTLLAYAIFWALIFPAILMADRRFV